MGLPTCWHMRVKTSTPAEQVQKALQSVGAAAIEELRWKASMAASVVSFLIAWADFAAGGDTKAALSKHAQLEHDLQAGTDHERGNILVVFGMLFMDAIDSEGNLANMTSDEFLTMVEPGLHYLGICGHVCLSLRVFLVGWRLRSCSACHLSKDGVLTSGKSAKQQIMGELSDKGKKAHASLCSSLSAVPPLAQETAAVSDKLAGNLLTQADVLDSVKRSCNDFGVACAVPDEEVNTKIEEGLFVVCASTALKILESKAAKNFLPAVRGKVWLGLSMLNHMGRTSTLL